MPAAKLSVSRAKSSGTAHRGDAAMRSLYWTTPVACAGRGQPLGIGREFGQRIDTLQPRPTRREILRWNAAQLVAAGGIVPGVAGARDLARYVIGGQRPPSAAAFQEDAARGAVGAAEGQQQEHGRRQNTRRAEDGLTGYIDHVHDACGGGVAWGRLGAGYGGIGKHQHALRWIHGPGLLPGDL